MKVLVIRLSSIGDIVLTSPVVRCLHEQLPGVELHMMVKRPFACIPDASPYVARTLVYGEPLEEERYDVVVDLQCNARSRRLCRQLRPARRLTFDKRNLAKLMLTLFKRPLLPIGHVCDRYLQAVAPLGVQNDGRGLDFFIPDGTALPEGLTSGAYSVLVVGATRATKTIPLGHLQEMALSQSHPVVLLGGRQEAQRTAAVPWPSHVVDLCGKTTLMQSAAILRDALQVVAPDTGMMHIAVALGAKLTLYWGSTSPHYGFEPHQPSGRPVTEHRPSCWCHPCGKLGRKRCPLGHYHCMENHFQSYDI